MDCTRNAQISTCNRRYYDAAVSCSGEYTLGLYSQSRIDSIAKLQLGIHLVLAFERAV